MWANFNSTFEPVGLVEASHASMTDGFLFCLSGNLFFYIGGCSCLIQLVFSGISFCFLTYQTSSDVELQVALFVCLYVHC